MGTKLQLARNPLATTPAINFSDFQLDDWESLGKIRELIENFHRQVSWVLKDRMLEQHQIEFIKKMMLDQENIYQHQVRELHRLYSVERMLMNELKSEIKHTLSGTSKAEMKTPESVNSQVQSVREIDQSLREKSGSCSSEIPKMQKGFDLERAAEHEQDMSSGVSATDFEERNRPSTNNDENCNDVELTLSIGNRRLESHKNLQLEKPREVYSFSIFKGEEFSDSSNTPKAAATSSKNKEKGKQSHWVFQDLSLSKT